MTTAPVHVDEWAGEDVSIQDVEQALFDLREESAHETTGPDLRTSVMTHLAWVPDEWHEAALDTLAGLGERHPSRGIILSPDPDAADGLDAKVSVLAFPLRAKRQHVAAEVIELRLRGRSALAPASIVLPFVAIDLPVFLRWRGRPPFHAPELEQLLELCDRFIVDSREWPDVPDAYRELPFERAACSDIDWRRTELWRETIAGLWPEIGNVRELAVTGPSADAALLVGWLRSRLRRDIDLVHEEGADLEQVAFDGEEVGQPAGDIPSPSDLLSAELDQYRRDRVYEEAVASA